MGFLLGKTSDAALSEFETTNEKVNYNAFGNNERSINKSLQTYRYREKGAFSYEFQYMSDTDYENLLYIINNRNSLREGMILLPISAAEIDTTCILTPTYGTTHKAWKLNGMTTKPWLSELGDITKTELSQSEYTDIGAYDTSYVELASDATNYQGFLLQFDLTNFLAAKSYKQLRRLTLPIIGMRSSPARVFLWSPYRSLWYLVDDRYYYDSTSFDDPTLGSASFSLNKQIVVAQSLPWGSASMYDEFVNGTSKVVTFMVCANALSQSMVINLARLYVNGCWVAADDPNDFENWSTPYIGSGRSGTLKLSEI
jgi:hypothetical protein